MNAKSNLKQRLQKKDRLDADSHKTRGGGRADAKAVTANTKTKPRNKSEKMKGGGFADARGVDEQRKGNARGKSTENTRRPF